MTNLESLRNDVLSLPKSDVAELMNLQRVSDVIMHIYRTAFDLIGLDVPTSKPEIVGALSYTFRKQFKSFNVDQVTDETLAILVSRMSDARFGLEQVLTSDCKTGHRGTDVLAFWMNGVIQYSNNVTKEEDGMKKIEAK